MTADDIRVQVDDCDICESNGLCVVYLTPDGRVYCICFACVDAMAERVALERAADAQAEDEANAGAEEVAS